MGKVQWTEKYQTIARILLIFLGVISLILRVRKMIQNSMIGAEPTGWDWYMVIMWMVMIPLLFWELIRKKGKKKEMFNGVKVSRKTYRDRQNQATGPLVVAGVAFLMLCYHGYMILFEHKEVDWDVYIWLIMLPFLLIIWRIRENKLKKLEVEE